MPRSTNIQLNIEKLDEKGRGLAFYQELALAFSGTIPGETIQVSRELIEKKQKNWQLEKNFQIVKASADRVPAPCAYYANCGGCQLQHMSYERQIKEKQHWLEETLNPIIAVEKIRPILASPRPLHYRRRIQLHVGPRGELGYYSPYSQKVVDIDRCLLAEETINRQILPLKSKALELLQGPRRSAQLGYELTLQDSTYVEIKTLHEERGFLQVNPEANELMLNSLKELLAQEKVQDVLELFAGEGNLGFALAKMGQHWTAVESNPLSVQRALENPKQKDLNLEWMESSAESAVKKLISKNKRFDLLLLDPPRQGVGQLMTDLLKLKAKSILYLSCWPRNLLSDLRPILKSGYDLEYLQPIDFFPQTMHVETLAFCRLLSI